MPSEPMTLIERLRNPQWDLVGRQGAILNVETTRKTMREAADKLERLGEQRRSQFNYVENLKLAILKAESLFCKPGDHTREIEEVLTSALAANKPKAGDWLDIGGESNDGSWGNGRIEVRVSQGGSGWQWFRLTEAQKKWLVGLANTDPEGRDCGGA